jgi:hypothetical protein
MQTCSRTCSRSNVVDLVFISSVRQSYWYEMAADNRGPEVMAAGIAMLVISTITTLLRIYCRGWVIKTFGYDDWLAVIAQILFITFCAYNTIGVIHGTGRHIGDIPPNDIPEAMKVS